MRKINLFKGRGFSLIEMMVAILILAVAIIGLLKLFVYTLNLNKLAGDMNIAISEAQGKLEEMRNCDFDDITTDYASGGTPGNTFSLARLNGAGIIYIDSTNPELLKIEIVVSWMTLSRRIIGEDSNLNGTLDSGEDNNGNGVLDSPTSLITMIAKR